MNVESIQAVDTIRAECDIVPEVGIVLGSGQGGIAARVDSKRVFAYDGLPGLPQPTAAGHAGALTFGSWCGRSCVVAQGRSHLYEGRSRAEVTAVVRLLIELGIERLILTNAAGGLHPRFRAGEVMLIRDHINLMGRGFLDVEFAGSDSAGASRGTVPASPYDQAWGDLLLGREPIQDSPLRQGVYVGVLGPNYETRAEYRMLRRIGGDAVGMSTVPESLVACHAGVRVLGLSIITNEAKPDAPQKVSHEEVIDWAARAEVRLGDAIEAALTV